MYFITVEKIYFKINKVLYEFLYVGGKYVKMKKKKMYNEKLGPFILCCDNNVTLC